MASNDFVRDRLLHPVVGPFVWTFLIINYEIPIAVLGAVAHPGEAIEVLRAWSPRYSFELLAAYALVPIFWIFGAPRLQRWWIKLERERALKIENDRLKVIEKANVPFSLFMDAIQRGRTMKEAWVKANVVLGEYDKDETVIAEVYQLGNRGLGIGNQLNSILEKLKPISTNARNLGSSSDQVLLDRAQKEGFVPEELLAKARSSS